MRISKISEGPILKTPRSRFILDHFDSKGQSGFSPARDCYFHHFWNFQYFQKIRKNLLKQVAVNPVSW